MEQPEKRFGKEIPQMIESKRRKQEKEF